MNTVQSFSCFLLLTIKDKIQKKECTVFMTTSTMDLDLSIM